MKPVLKILGIIVFWFSSYLAPEDSVDNYSSTKLDSKDAEYGMIIPWQCLATYSLILANHLFFYFKKCSSDKFTK